MYEPVDITRCACNGEISLSCPIVIEAYQMTLGAEGRSLEVCFSKAIFVISISQFKVKLNGVPLLILSSSPIIGHCLYYYLLKHILPGS